jgi:chemotaxis protein MotA
MAHSVGFLDTCTPLLRIASFCSSGAQKKPRSRRRIVDLHRGESGHGMDIFSIVGLVLAIAGVLGGMVLEGGHPTALLQVTAFLIVIVGSLGATLVATLPSDVPFALKSLKKVFLPAKYDFAGTMEKLLELANLARREGLLALETFTTSGNGDPFLVKCLTLAIDGSSAEAIRETVEVDMHIQEEDDKAGMKFWESWGALAPTIGVLGAVLGLMHVMSVLDQPSMIGPGISVASKLLRTSRSTTSAMGSLLLSTLRQVDLTTPGRRRSSRGALGARARGRKNGRGASERPRESQYSRRQPGEACSESTRGS